MNISSRVVRKAAAKEKPAAFRKDGRVGLHVAYGFMGCYADASSDDDSVESVRSGASSMRSNDTAAGKLLLQQGGAFLRGSIFSRKDDEYRHGKPPYAHFH